MKPLRVYLLAGAFLGFSSMLVSCSTATPHEYHMDYPSYSSVGDMCANASLVVTGTPISFEVRNVNILSADQGDSPEENPALGTGEKPDNAYIVETVVTFQVETVILGSSAKEGSRIEVGQPGGEYQGVNYLAEQYSMEMDETHLLFLQEFDDVPANLLNPSQAGFRLADDRTIARDSASSLVADATGLTADSTLCS